MSISSRTALSCRTCTVRPLCFGGGLAGDNLRRFEAGRGPVRVLRQGQHLFRAGEECDTVYVVRSGTLKTVEPADKGQERSTGFYFPGEVLGLDGMEAQRHRGTAVSLETSSVCPISYSALVSLCAGIKGLREQVWRIMSREIGSKQSLLMTIETKDASGRLASFLLSLSERLKRIGYSATDIRLPMGRQEIGDYLDLNLETVSRVLTRFHNARLIDRDRRSVRLLDMPQLRALGEGSEDCLEV